MGNRTILADYGNEFGEECVRETAAPTNTFIKRHRTGLTILGALISTFVVKENPMTDGEREQLPSNWQIHYSDSNEHEHEGKLLFIVGIMYRSCIGI
jgi:hypothetical protein